MKTLIFWGSLIAVLYFTTLKPMMDNMKTHADMVDAKIEQQLGK